MTVTELIQELQQVADPDNTEAVVDESEVDHPGEFVSISAIIHGG